MLVPDRPYDTPESNSVASSAKSQSPAAPTSDAHRRIQQPQMDDQSSNDDSSGGRGSPNLSGYNPDSDGSSPDDGDNISYRGAESQPLERLEGKLHELCYSMRHDIVTRYNSTCSP